MIPLFFDIAEKEILIVGGGRSAGIKLNTMLAFTHAIRVVSPEISETVAEQAARNGVKIERRAFLPDDLHGVHLVFAAANKIVNEQIYAEAKKAGVLCCKAEGGGDFIMGACKKQGDMVAAVSTNGKFPMLAKKMCQEMDLSASKYLDDLEKYRRFILNRYTDRVYARKVLAEMADAVQDPAELTRILGRIGYDEY